MENEPIYTCDQHEADTKIFYHVSKMILDDAVTLIVIDAEDTDVVAIAAAVAHNLDVPLFLYRDGKLFDCNAMCSVEVCDIIIQLHVFTGCDSVSGFFGHGKSSVYPKPSNIEEVKQLLASLGSSKEINNALVKSIEKFVIKFVYNDNKSESLAECRALKWEQMKKKTTGRLPPDPDSFELHVKRANFQCYIFRHYMGKRCSTNTVFTWMAFK